MEKKEPSKAAKENQDAEKLDVAESSATVTSDGLAEHLELLTLVPKDNEHSELHDAPIFTASVKTRVEAMVRGQVPADHSPAGHQVFTQHGILGADASVNLTKIRSPGDAHDGRIFHNIAAPSSIFVCGSQGSGKSHTLSCLLENCLLPSVANVLPRPLTGVVFHYDAFTTDSGGEPCEAAHLASHLMVDVRVLCAPSNVNTIRNLYSKIPGVKVQPLLLDETDLNTKRMMGLMGVDESHGIPLYLHVVQRILRDLRTEQQNVAAPNSSSQRFQYAAFKAMIEREDLTPAQLAPLKQRLETLESFMVSSQVPSISRQKKTGGGTATDWTPTPGQLTIVDLSCPSVKADTACSLFNICLSLFLEQDSSKVGRVVALDEAHKYMGWGGANGAGAASVDARALTGSLLSTIRLQRHQGCRVIVATQEPSVSPALLDLCSVTIVHRFTSPDWLHVLTAHLAGAAVMCPAKDGRAAGLFSRIVELRVGEALMFAPSAAVGVCEGGKDSEGRVFRRLGSGVLKVRIRNRVTADGGRSIMAS